MEVLPYSLMIILQRRCIPRSHTTLVVSYLGIHYIGGTQILDNSEPLYDHNGQREQRSPVSNKDYNPSPNCNQMMELCQQRSLVIASNILIMDFIWSWWLIILGCVIAAEPNSGWENQKSRTNSKLSLTILMMITIQRNGMLINCTEIQECQAAGRQLICRSLMLIWRIDAGRSAEP